MDPTFFRPAATDFDALTALWEASVRATHHFLDEAYIRYLKPLIRNEYLKSVELYGLRGNDGAIVAFMGVSERKIEMLFVDPAFREMGLGRHLVEYAIDRLHVTRVDVNEQNEQAAGFYARLGFRYVSRSETDGSGRPYPILHLELPHSGMKLRRLTYRIRSDWIQCLFSVNYKTEVYAVSFISPGIRNTHIRCACRNVRSVSNATIVTPGFGES